MIKLLIAEDDVLISEQLLDILETLGYEVAEIAFDYDSAVSVLKNEKVDMAILDIKMHGEDQGFQIAAHINQQYTIPFIFLTSFSDEETVEKAISLNPAGYLVKPFSQQDIYTTLTLVQNQMETPQESIQIKDGWSKAIVPVSDILWVKSDDKYIEIQTKVKKYLERISITEFMEKVNNKKLQRVHRSYLINIEKVSNYNSKYVEINSNKIPISRTYKGNILKILLK